ncbi:MAG: M20/M25/M40 family metallo-hydrolase [Candidatus Aegiribacteria sp.]|nr:M20/M25/M40 family metallo-hydrolase [Candidatus Aegiribacteria sp.]
MKILFIVLYIATTAFSGGLVLVEQDIREVLPLDAGITVYFVEEEWFLAEAPETWGTLVATSPEGLYIAHISKTDAKIPGTVLFSRNGIVLFQPDTPLPMQAYDGIMLISPLRPYSDRAFLSPASSSWSRDPGTIEDVLALLEEDSLIAHIQALEDFENRLCILPEYFESAFWVADKFESYGLESVAVDTFDFEFSGTTFESANVQAELPGTLADPGIILITSHLDAITYGSPSTPAPGADDNASGSAAVIEAARIFSQFEFPNTVRFVCFGAEELGLIGSAYYAENAAAAGENIQAVMNLDMILFAPDSMRALFVPYNSQSTFIATMFGDIAETYVPELDVEVLYAPGVTYSDHASFWQNGFPALLGIEAAVDENPFFHSEADLLVNYEEFWPFGTECTKAALAFVANAALTDWLGIEGSATALPWLVASPNPASGTINVSIGGADPSQIIIYDLSGRRMLTGTGSSMDVSVLASGVYLLRVSSENGIQSTRIVISK